MTLTEQWKKGELKDGWYYITTSFADEALREYFDGDEFRTVFTCNVKEVLAPVPSYDRFCRLNHLENDFIKAHERINELKKENAQLHKFLEEFNALDVAKENKQLKELLKECREWIEFLDVKMKSEKNTKNAMYFEVLLLKIDNAIGEKK